LLPRDVPVDSLVAPVSMLCRKARRFPMGRSPKIV